jgi:hypothetical protein
VRRPHLAASALAALLACGACGGEPRVRTAATVAGDWVMTEREGKPLPNTTRYPLADRSCTSVLIRNVITLRANGSYAEVTEARHWCDGLTPPDTSSIVHSGGRWELRGARGDTINLVDPETIDVERQKGVFSGDEMHLERTVLSPHRIVRYRYTRADAGR